MRSPVMMRAGTTIREALGVAIGTPNVDRFAHVIVSEHAVFCGAIRGPAAVFIRVGEGDPVPRFSRAAVNDPDAIAHLSGALGGVAVDACVDLRAALALSDAASAAPFARVRLPTEEPVTLPRAALASALASGALWGVRGVRAVVTNANLVRAAAARPPAPARTLALVSDDRNWIALCTEASLARVAPDELVSLNDGGML